MVSLFSSSLFFLSGFHWSYQNRKDLITTLCTCLFHTKSPFCHSLLKGIPLPTFRCLMPSCPLTSFPSLKQQQKKMGLPVRFSTGDSVLRLPQLGTTVNVRVTLVELGDTCSCPTLAWLDHHSLHPSLSFFFKALSYIMLLYIWHNFIRYLKASLYHKFLYLIN